MEEQKERRRWPRDILQPSNTGADLRIIQVEDI